MNIKQLNEELKKALNEELSDEFMLSNLHYKITYNSGRSYEKVLLTVDTLNYKLYDLGTEQIVDIVLKNTEDNGLKLGSNDSSLIDYNANSGVIKNVRPIAITNDEGEQKGTLSFEVVLWTHPEQIDRK